MITSQRYGIVAGGNTDGGQKTERNCGGTRLGICAGGTGRTENSAGVLAAVFAYGKCGGLFKLRYGFPRGKHSDAYPITGKSCYPGK